jgi:hypothetical protein
MIRAHTDKAIIRNSCAEVKKCRWVRKEGGLVRGATGDQKYAVSNLDKSTNGFERDGAD